MSDKVYNDKFSPELLSRNIVIRTYSNEKVNVLGKTRIAVEYNGKVFDGFHVNLIKGNDVNLMGRNWLSVIRLNWNEMFEKYELNCNVLKANEKAEIHAELNTIK